MTFLINDILKMFISYKYFIRCMCVNLYVLYTKVEVVLESNAAVCMTCRLSVSSDCPS